MALEDLAMMRAVWGSTVLYPSDPNQTAQLVNQMAERKGITFMRTTRASWTISVRIITASGVCTI